MKKKIISSILAVAMMASIAIPSVFAVSSDVAGDAKKVSKITMKDDKSVYQIEVGEKVDFSDKINVYEDETKLVTDHNHIRYMLNGNTGSGNTGDFRIDNSEITAIKAGAKATLTIFDNYNASSNARVTITLETVSKNAAFTEYAESFTFAKPSYDLPYVSAYGESEGVELKLEAHPKGSKFGRDSIEQAAILNTAKSYVLPKLGAALGLGYGVIVGGPIASTNFTDGVAYSAGVASVGAATIGAITTAVASDKVALAIDGVTISDVTLSGTPNTAALVGAAVFAGITDADANTVGVQVMINGKKFTVAQGATNDIITFTSADLDVAGYVPSPVLTHTIAATSAVAKIAITGANTTAGSIKTAGTKAKIVYDFKDAAALATGEIIEIGGEGTSVVGALTTTVEQQLDQWIANSSTGDIGDIAAGDSPLGVASTAKRSGKTLTIESDEAATSITAITITAAMKATAFKSTSTGTIPTVAEMEALGFTVSYTVDDGVTDYKGILINIPATFLNDPANKALIQSYQYGAFLWGSSTRTVLTEKINKFAPQTGTFTAQTNLLPLDAVRATSFQIPSNIDVVVGKTVEVPVTFYPPNANVGKKALFEIKSAQNDGKPYQYAVIDGDTTVTDKVKVMGINSNAPGKATLVGKVINGQLTAYSTVNVKPTTYKPEGTDGFTSKISTTSIEVEAGKIAPITISNLPTGVTVKWTHKDDGTINLNKDNGSAVVVYGKKVGVNTITATLSNGESFTVAVTVKAATAVAPTPEKPSTGTDVPQTGDSLFANLF